MRTVLVAAMLAGLGIPAKAELVYQPVSPSFGGNPLNSAHLFGSANAQRNATASDSPTRNRAAAGDGLGAGAAAGAQSDADLFVRQLQGRLLSALAGQVTEAIFGENPQEAGTVQFGDTTVSFSRTLDSIRLVINDAGAGTVTEIVVPQLVVN